MPLNHQEKEFRRNMLEFHLFAVIAGLFIVWLAVGAMWVVMYVFGNPLDAFITVIPFTAALLYWIWWCWGDKDFLEGGIDGKRRGSGEIPDRNLRS